MEYAAALTNEIFYHAADHEECKHAGRGWEKCTAIGGFLMSWVDEFWKGAKAQAACTPTYRDADFSPKNCGPKAHVTCGNWDAAYHDICGYQLDAAPDHYVNEEWFGITSPTHCAGAINSLRPRPIFFKMRELWSGEETSKAELENLHALFGDCDAIVTEKCVALGNGGRSDLFDWIHGSEKHEDASGALVCSGHGSCTTDWRECGAGGANFSATPCCSCDFGFAGDGCAQLDVRLCVPPPTPPPPAALTLVPLDIPALASSRAPILVHLGSSAGPPRLPLPPQVRRAGCGLCSRADAAADALHRRLPIPPRPSML